MHRSEFSQIDDKGVHLDENLLKSIGIRQGAQCWGVFIDGRRSHVAQSPPLVHLDDDLYDPKAQGPHLIISALKPDLWISSARLTVKISDRPGALSDLFAVVAKNSNIELFEISPMGYRHSEITMIISNASFTSWAKEKFALLSDKISEIYNKMDNIDRVENMRREFFSHIGSLINMYLSNLVAEIMLADLRLINCGSSILSERFMKLSTRPWFANYRQIISTGKLIDELSEILQDSGGSFCDKNQVRKRYEELDNALKDDPYKTGMSVPWFTRTAGSLSDKEFQTEGEYWAEHMKWREDFAARSWRDGWTPTIITSPLSHLAYAKIWAVKKSPLRLIYSQTGDSSRPTIACVGQNGENYGMEPLREVYREANAIVHNYQDLGIEESSNPNDADMTHAVVDPDGLWVRLRFLQHGFSKIYGIKIEVSIGLVIQDNDIDSVEAKGLLAAVCKEIKNQHADIRMAYNELRPSPIKIKSVVLSIYCVLDAKERDLYRTNTKEYHQNTSVYWKGRIRSALNRYSSVAGLTLVQADIKISHWDGKLMDEDRS